MKLTPLHKLALSTMASGFDQAKSNEALAINFDTSKLKSMAKCAHGHPLVVGEKINKLEKGKAGLPTWSMEAGSILVPLTERQLRKISWWHSVNKSENETIFFVVIGFHEQDKTIVTKENYLVSIRTDSRADVFLDPTELTVSGTRLFEEVSFDLESIGYTE